MKTSRTMNSLIYHYLPRYSGCIIANARIWPSGNPGLNLQSRKSIIPLMSGNKIHISIFINVSNIGVVWLTLLELNLCFGCYQQVSDMWRRTTNKDSINIKWKFISINATNIHQLIAVFEIFFSWSYRYHRW